VNAVVKDEFKFFLIIFYLCTKGVQSTAYCTVYIKGTLLCVLLLCQECPRCVKQSTLLPSHILLNPNCLNLSGALLQRYEV
jgi:hypothetical protein